jgi:hypothetical protein
MLITYNNIALRRVAGSALGIGACVISSAAFAAQNLVLAFGNGSAVPIDGWTTIAIALMLAVCTLVLSRRKGASRFAQWSLLAVTGGALCVIPPAPDADAAVGNLLVTSPFTLPIACTFVPSTLTFQNATGGPTTIQSVTLNGSGGCVIVSAPPPVSQGLAVSVSPQCTAHPTIAQGATCTVTLVDNSS